MRYKDNYTLYRTAMGVPRLYPWLTETFRDIVRMLKITDPSTVKMDNLYIDSQSIIHACCQLVFNYGQKARLMNAYSSLSYEQKVAKAYELFFDQIKNIVKMVRPTDTLYISNDGPAPLAKQAQQRQRRFISSKEKKGDFDSNSLTPGTLFMFGLTKYINYSIRKEMQSNPIWKNIKVIFSGCNDPGEGEHKLCEHIRSLSEKDRETKSHCIVGPDGDLIMLALSIHVPKIYILREDMDLVNVYHLVDMGVVKKELPKVLVPSGPPRSIRSTNDLANDFVIIGFLVGNDFLPKIQMFMYLEDGLELMIKEYLSLDTPAITKNDQIDLGVLTNFIEKISRREKEYLESQIPISRQIMYDSSKGVFSDRAMFIDHTLLACSTNREVDMEKYRRMYYKKSNIHLDSESLEGEDQVVELCLDYIKTLIWIGKYYIEGLPSWDFYYPWHYPPLMVDLARVLSNLQPQDYAELSNFPKDSPSKPFVQLLSVLPPKSSHLLPPIFRKLMEDPNSPLVKSGMYNTDFKIDYEGKTKAHFGIVLLNFADIVLVRRCYDLLMAKILKQVHKKESEIFKRNGLIKSTLFQFDPKYNVKYTSVFGHLPAIGKGTINVKATYL